MALVREAEAVFRKHDDGFQFLEYPVEIRVSGEKHILYEGRIDLGSFEVWVLHGYYLGMPGRDPCISVVRKGACPVVDANTSALFLDSGTLEMVHGPITDATGHTLRPGATSPSLDSSSTL
jgi:hypothetical protein